MPTKPRRLIYDYDAWGPFIRPEAIEGLRANVDMLEGSQVNTVMLNPNFGQGMCYPSDASAEVFRGAAAALYSQGSDGISLFNMYVCRGNNPDPEGRKSAHLEPQEIMSEVGDPATLEGTDKLYAVDTVSPLFNHPLVDPQALLPGDVSPRYPLVTKLFVGERNAAARKCMLRVRTDKPMPEVQFTVQVNGRGLGPGVEATTSQLFEEPYDQTMPEAKRSRDFIVNGEHLEYGENEIVVLASDSMTVTHIEMSVTG